MSIFWDILIFDIWFQLASPASAGVIGVCQLLAVLSLSLLSTTFTEVAGVADLLRRCIAPPRQQSAVP